MSSEPNSELDEFFELSLYMNYLKTSSIFPQIEKQMFTVTTSQDSVPGSLREVISRANLVPKAVVSILPSVGSKIILTDGEITIKTNLKLVNRTKNNLVIYPSGSQKIFHVTSPSKLVEITSLTHSLLLLDGEGDKGGAIFVDVPNHYMILRGITLSKNKAILGGAIFTLGRVVLDRSIIERNQAESQGGGIWSASGIFLEKSRIFCNEIVSDEPGNGGGGVFISQGNLISVKSQIKENSAIFGSGGGIVVIKGNINITDSEVSQNKASNSGGIEEGQGNINGNRSSISKNRSGGPNGGGGITIISGNVKLNRCKIVNNRTEGMFSGGIVSIVGDVSLSNTEITGNTNKGPGGGVALNFGSLYLDNSIISRNIGGSLGGGAVNFSPDYFIKMNNSTVSENILTDSQTISETIKSFLEILKKYLDQVKHQANVSDVDSSFLEEVQVRVASVWDIISKLDIMAKVGGGGLAILLATEVILDKVEISSNFSEDMGGGIYNHNGLVKLNKCLISKNRNLGNGGGIYNRGLLSISDSEVCSNLSNNGGGIFSSRKFENENNIIGDNSPNDIVII